MVASSADIGHISRYWEQELEKKRRGGKARLWVAIVKCVWWRMILQVILQGTAVSWEGSRDLVLYSDAICISDIATRDRYNNMAPTYIYTPFLLQVAFLVSQSVILGYLVDYFGIQDPTSSETRDAYLYAAGEYVGYIQLGSHKYQMICISTGPHNQPITESVLTTCVDISTSTNANTRFNLQSFCCFVV